MSLKSWWRGKDFIKQRNESQELRREYKESLKQQEQQQAQERYITEGGRGRRAARTTARGLRIAGGLPYRVGSGEESLVGKIFSTIATWFFGVAKIIGILLVVLLIIVIPVRFWATGTTDYAITKSGVVVRETGAPIAARTGFARVIDLIWNPYKPISEGSFAVDKTNDIKRFVEIEKISSPRKFQSQESILLNVNFIAHNLEKESKSTILADFPEYERQINIQPLEVKLPVTEDSEGNTIILPLEIEFPFTAILLFPSGIEVKKQVEGASGKVKIIYETTAESVWRAYGYHSDNFKKGQDPLDLINDDLLTSNGIGKSRISYDSPVRITFSVDQKQPFKEDIFYPFTVDLRKEALSKGNMNKLNKLILLAPKNIILNDDRRFCDFVETTEINGFDTTQFTVYKVSDTFLNYVNTDCSKELLKSEGITEEECESIYKEENHAVCSFKFENIPKEQRVPNFVEFKAFAEYTFTVEKAFFVGLIPARTTVVENVCKPINNEVDCIDAKGCRPVNDELGKFISCEECPLSLTVCTDYTTQSECENNHCNLGNCEWQTNRCVEVV